MRTRKQYNKNYNSRMRANGWKRVSLLIPCDVEEQLKEYKNILVTAYRGKVNCDEH